jgi:hypothetical protein
VLLSKISALINSALSRRANSHCLPPTPPRA